MSLIEKYEINVEKIKETVKQDGFIVVKLENLFNLVNLARKEYAQSLKDIPLTASKYKFDYRDIKKNPIRKLSIGSKNSLGEEYGQVLQTTFIDCMNSEYEALNEIFQLIIELRNTLMGVELTFGFDGKEYWNASRVHHYPSGGGFMTIHRDTYFSNKIGDMFYQLLVPMSRKGEDFLSGGGVVIDLHGNKFNTDEIAGVGSIIIFDGRILHGVDDVDSGEIIDFNSDKGRIALVSNVYEIYTEK